MFMDQASDMERHHRSLQIEIDNLQRQLQSSNAERDSSMQETRRLADDLAAVSCEIRTMQKELEASKSEAHDLKRQLQTYVSEVRRAEELIGHKVRVYFFEMNLLFLTKSDCTIFFLRKTREQIC